MAYESELSDSWRSDIAQSSILLLQREIPENINIEVAKCAKANNVTVILDMGGRDDPISRELISLCDIISPNESEVRRLFVTTNSHNTEEVKGDAAEDSQITEFLKQQKSGLKLLMKQGSEGSCLIWLEDKDGSSVLRKEHVPALKFSDYPNFKLVDTTCAGDAYSAAFAVKYASYLDNRSGTITSEIESMIESMKFASKVAFLCISKFGTTSAIPNLSEVQRLDATTPATSM